MATLHIMRGYGHKHAGDEEITFTKLDWRVAEEKFIESKAAGFMAFIVNDYGKKEILHRFDPKADKIVMTPAYVGG